MSEGVASKLNDKTMVHLIMVLTKTLSNSQLDKYDHPLQKIIKTPKLWEMQIKPMNLLLWKAKSLIYWNTLIATQVIFSRQSRRYRWSYVAVFFILLKHLRTLVIGIFFRKIIQTMNFAVRAISWFIWFACWKWVS